MAGAAKADIKYGFWVGLGVLIALAIWGVISMMLHGSLPSIAGLGGNG
jgi:hypothetical protein